MAETMTATPLRVSRLATNPILSTFMLRSSLEKLRPLERLVLTMSASRTSTLRPRSRISFSTISAMVVLPAPERPVNHNVKPRWTSAPFSIHRLLSVLYPLLRVRPVVYIPNDTLSGPLPCQDASLTRRVRPELQPRPDADRQFLSSGLPPRLL